MKIHNIDVRLQEVPNEVSLSISVANCKIGCKGCHWSEINQEKGKTFNLDDLDWQLTASYGLLTCILFMGGENDKNLPLMLQICREKGFKTCLYTGLTRVGDDILQHLDYLKVGPWEAELGGLKSPTTNQRFYKVSNKQLEDLTHLFREGE